MPELSFKWLQPDSVGRYVIDEMGDVGEIDFAESGPEPMIVWPNITLGAN